MIVSPGGAGSNLTESSGPASMDAVSATRPEDTHSVVSREPYEGAAGNSTNYTLWQDVDVDSPARDSVDSSARVAAASVAVRERHAQGSRCTEVVTAFAMAAAVALCALLGTAFGDSSDSGLAGAAIALVVGAVCGAVIGLCYRWHDSSSPI